MTKTMTAIAALALALGTTPAPAQVILGLGGDTLASLSLGSTRADVGVSLGRGGSANPASGNGIAADVDLTVASNGTNGPGVATDADLSVDLFGNDDSDADAIVVARLGGPVPVGAKVGVNANLLGTESSDADVVAVVADNNLNADANLAVTLGSANGTDANADVNATLGNGDGGTLADIEIIADVGAGSNGNGSGTGGSGAGGAGSGGSGTDGAGTGGAVTETSASSSGAGGAAAEICADIDWSTAKTVNLACLEKVRLILWTEVAQSSSPYLGIFEQSGAGAHPSVASRVASNAQMRAELERYGFEPSDVVAIRASTEGEALLFVNNRA